MGSTEDRTVTVMLTMKTDLPVDKIGTKGFWAPMFVMATGTEITQVSAHDPLKVDGRAKTTAPLSSLGVRVG